MKLRFRFSLRTLVILALLLGSAGLLWHNKECWAPHAVFKISSSHPGAQFESCRLDGRDRERICAEFKLAGSRQLQFYDLKSGALLSDETFDLDKDGYIYLCGERFAIFGIPIHTYLKDRQSGAVVNFHHNIGNPLIEIRETANPSIVLVKTDADLSLLKLPEFVDVRRFKPEKAQLTPDRKTLVALNGQNVQFYSVETGKLEREWDAPSGASRFQIAPDGKKLVFNSTVVLDSGVREHSAIIYDESGKELHKFDTLGNANMTGDGKFLIFDKEVWQLEPEIARTATIGVMPVGASRMLSNPILQETPTGLECVDPSTGKILWKKENKTADVLPFFGYGSGNSELMLRRSVRGSPKGSAPGALIDPKTGEELFVFSPERWPSAFPEHFLFLLHTDFMTVRKSLDPNAPVDAIVWRQRRPREWWGLAWLPELWLSVVLALAFLWSILRDRRQA